MALYGAFMLALFYGSAFVVQLFAFCAAELHFDDAIFEEHGERDQGEAFFAAKGFEFGDLSFMQKEFSLSSLFMIVDIAKSGKTVAEALRLLASRGILLTPERRTSIRAVTHLDVTSADVERASAVFHEIFR